MKELIQITQTHKIAELKLEMGVFGMMPYLND